MTRIAVKPVDTGALIPYIPDRCWSISRSPPARSSFYRTRRICPTPSVVNVTTDAIGHASFVRLTQGLPAGKFLTALTRHYATSADNPTLVVSEFSACRQVAPANDRIFASGFE